MSHRPTVAAPASPTAASRLMLKIMLIVKQGVSSESITREHVAVTSLRQQKPAEASKIEIAILNSSILFLRLKINQKVWQSLQCHLNVSCSPLGLALLEMDT